MRALRLVRFELTVGDLDAAGRFYAGLPGIRVLGRDQAEPARAALLGAASIEQLHLQRGDQRIVLQRVDPAGASYPADHRSNDGSFQHFALPVADAAAAVAALPPGATPVSTHGAQALPAASGGATAFKFRDAEGHPLEFIQFAAGTGGGIDHSAVVVADVERSIRFYQETLGLTVAARQVNRGPEQDRLDGLSRTEVEVVALQPTAPTPHLELLAYRAPRVRPCPPPAPADIAGTRLVFAVDAVGQPGARLADGRTAALLRDPDGHLFIVEG